MTGTAQRDQESRASSCLGSGGHVTTRIELFRGDSLG